MLGDGQPIPPPSPFTPAPHSAATVAIAEVIRGHDPAAECLMYGLLKGP